MDASFIDLDILPTKVRNPQSRTYFLDSVRAYKAGALRAALTSTWVAFVYDRAAGDDITTLDGQTLIAVFEKTFAELREEAMKRHGDDWLKARSAGPTE